MFNIPLVSLKIHISVRFFFANFTRNTEVKMVRCPDLKYLKSVYATILFAYETFVHQKNVVFFLSIIKY